MMLTYVNRYHVNKKEGINDPKYIYTYIDTWFMYVPLIYGSFNHISCFFMNEHRKAMSHNQDHTSVTRTDLFEHYDYGLS